MCPSLSLALAHTRTHTLFLFLTPSHLVYIIIYIYLKTRHQIYTQIEGIGWYEVLEFPEGMSREVHPNALTSAEKTKIHNNHNSFYNETEAKIV